MQRSARLKAMLRHSPSGELINLCRSFWKNARSIQGHNIWHNTHSLVADLIYRAYHKILDYFRIPLRLLIHLSQDVQDIWRKRQKVHFCIYPLTECGFKAINWRVFSVFLPSMASPSASFFRYLVISAELSDVEAEILTRGKEPEDESSAKRKRSYFNQNLWVAMWF